MEDYQFLFKIVLIGNAGVGKTCLVRRFIQGDFPVGQAATIGVDFMIKPMVVRDIKINLQLWDTAGQERFRSITQSYYRSAHCLVVVYDISAQPTFDSLNQWCKDIEQFSTSSTSTNSSSITNNTNNAHSSSFSSISSSSQAPLRILVGNKCDKEREIPESIGQQYAASHNFDIFLETSALQTDNVQKLFQIIADRLVERKLAQLSRQTQTSMLTLDSSGGSKSGDHSSSWNHPSLTLTSDHQYGAGETLVQQVSGRFSLLRSSVKNRIDQFNRNNRTNGDGEDGGKTSASGSSLTNSPCCTG